jgi:SPP1 family predicted phage head-tail adaptor
MEEFAGSLRERITIQRPVDTPDGGGGAHRQWQDVQTVWAAVHPVARDEQRYGAHVASRARFGIVLRADGVIAADARLLWRGMILGIVSVLHDPATQDRCTIFAEREPDA